MEYKQLFPPPILCPLNPLLWPEHPWLVSRTRWLRTPRMGPWLFQPKTPTLNFSNSQSRDLLDHYFQREHQKQSQELHHTLSACSINLIIKWWESTQSFTYTQVKKHEGEIQLEPCMVLYVCKSQHSGGWGRKILSLKVILGYTDWSLVSKTYRSPNGKQQTRPKPSKNY